MELYENALDSAVTAYNLEVAKAYRKMEEGDASGMMRSRPFVIAVVKAYLSSMRSASPIADDVQKLKVALVEAVIPLEAIKLSGADGLLSEALRNGVDHAIVYVRNTLAAMQSTPEPSAEDKRIAAKRDAEKAASIGHEASRLPREQSLSIADDLCAINAENGASPIHPAFTDRAYKEILEALPGEREGKAKRNTAERPELDCSEISVVAKINRQIDIHQSILNTHSVMPAQFHEGCIAGLIDARNILEHSSPKPVMSNPETIGQCPQCKRDTLHKFHRCWNVSIDCKGCGFHDIHSILGEPYVG